MLGWALLLALTGPRAVAFPGATHAVIAPGGRYEVQWLAPAAGQDTHQLLLIDRQSGARRRLLAFRRRVEVLWSANGKRLAVTEHTGGGESNVYLWSNLAEPPADLQVDLRSQLPLSDPLASSRHLSLAAEAWLDEERLLIQVTAPGAPPRESPARRYEYRVGGEFRAR